jgi:hypothetical protein
MRVSIGKIIMKGVHFVTRTLAQYDGKTETSHMQPTSERCTTYQPVFSGKMETTKFFIAPAWI